VVILKGVEALATKFQALATKFEEFISIPQKGSPFPPRL
jgi:hypothetical protein